MLNTKFNAMKKISLLLLIFCLILQSNNVNASNHEGKVDITPKLQKGHSWNMVVELGGQNTQWNFDLKDDLSNWLPNNFMGMQDSKLKYEWDVSCLSSDIDKLFLRFELKRIIEESRLKSDNLEYLVYNDTDYPLTLNQEDISKIDEIIGKIIDIEIPWNTDSTIIRTNNDFNGNNISFPSFTFQNRKAAKNQFVSFSSNNFSEILDKYFEAQNQPKSHEGRKAMILGALIILLGSTLVAWIIIKINGRRIKRREAARRKLSELELKAIRSQMNPHFIFNAMGSIQNLMNHNQTEKANLYLSRFAKLMRMVLSSSNKKLVSLADELELIRLYLELEKLRIDFRYNIKLVDTVNPETEEIPGMLLQPFVENAVIHGITPKGEGNIEVEISKSGLNLVCTIIDDGVGIDPAKTGNGNGLAMKFAEKRVNLLSEQLKTRMKLEVENRNVSEGKSGTKVTLVIPVE